MSKSYVSMERKVCLVCGKEFDTNSIIMDTRLKDSFETYTTTGFGLCEEDQKRYDDNFIALIGIDPDRSEIENNRVKPQDAYRTGKLIHVKKDILEGIFDFPIKTPSIYVEDDVINHFTKLHDKLHNEQPKEGGLNDETQKE